MKHDPSFDSDKIHDARGSPQVCDNSVDGHDVVGDVGEGEIVTTSTIILIPHTSVSLVASIDSIQNSCSSISLLWFAFHLNSKFS